jgi:hypothetical protein
MRSGVQSAHETPGSKRSKMVAAGGALRSAQTLVSTETDINRNCHANAPALDGSMSTAGHF